MHFIMTLQPNMCIGISYLLVVWYSYNELNIFLQFENISFQSTASAWVISIIFLVLPWLLEKNL